MTEESAKMAEMKELNLNEMEQVTGGKGGSRTRLPDKKGYIVHRIKKGETLSGIADFYGTTVDEIMAENKTITNRNDITSGYYIYVAY